MPKKSRKNMTAEELVEDKAKRTAAAKALLAEAEAKAIVFNKEQEEREKAMSSLKYTKELGKQICDALANSEDGIRLICQNTRHFPTLSTVKEWRHTYPEFGALYEKAKLKQALHFAEDIIDISDNLIDAFITTEKGAVPNPVAVQHARLRIDTRKWIACKLLPKVYGDKVQQEITLIKHEDALKELE